MPGRPLAVAAARGSPPMARHVALAVCRLSRFRRCFAGRPGVFLRQVTCCQERPGMPVRHACRSEQHLAFGASTWLSSPGGSDARGMPSLTAGRCFAGRPIVSFRKVSRRWTEGPLLLRDRAQGLALARLSQAPSGRPALTNIWPSPSRSWPHGTIWGLGWRTCSDQDLARPSGPVAPRSRAQRWMSG